MHYYDYDWGSFWDSFHDVRMFARVKWYDDAEGAVNLSIRFQVKKPQAGHRESGWRFGKRVR
jgi:hypothetical protein